MLMCIVSRLSQSGTELSSSVMTLRLSEQAGVVKRYDAEVECQT